MALLGIDLGDPFASARRTLVERTESRRNWVGEWQYRIITEIRFEWPCDNTGGDLDSVPLSYTYASASYRRSNCECGIGYESLLGTFTVTFTGPKGAWISED